MKNLAEKFLSKAEREKIIQTVTQVEKITSGEIVPLVVSSSYHYPLANMIGGLVFALIIAAGATMVVSIRKLWGGFTIYDLWIFPAVFGIALFLFHELIKRLPFLKRMFISREEIKEEVEEAALTSFYRQGLNNTRDQTGILLFISVFERQAWVLADRGINEKVPSGVWQEVVELIIEGIREQRQVEAICAAIKRCGELLKEHFPIKPDDTDELQNLIVED